MAFLPPGGASQIVFSFDTTGSMSSILYEVRGRLNDMVQRLQADIPGIEIAVFAHGDYCDEKEFYVTEHVNFTSDVPELCQFIDQVGGTGGGDADECYELVLRQVQDLSWKAGTQKSLVLIGDSKPHEADYELNTDNIDWREEVDKLKNEGVRIYAVQCMSEPGVEEFYKTLADNTGGRHLQLSEFANIFDFLMAICYREKGVEFLEDYEAEVRARKCQPQLGKDLEGLFGTLRDPVEDVITPPPSLGCPAAAAAPDAQPAVLPIVPAPKRINPFALARLEQRKRMKQRKWLRSKKDYEAEVRARKCHPQLGKDLEGSFGALRDPVEDDVTPPPSLGCPAAAAAPDAQPAVLPVVPAPIVPAPKRINPFALARLAKMKRMKQPKWLRSKKAFKLPKLNRTKVPHTNFLLNNMTWSPWKLIISDTKESQNLWRKRKGTPSYKRKMAYPDMRSKAIYEFSVQKQKGARREVVFFKVTDGLDSPNSWETKLLRDGSVRDKINSAISSGSSVFIRRAVLKRSQNVKDLTRKLRTIYSYSWIKMRLKKNSL